MTKQKMLQQSVAKHERYITGNRKYLFSTTLKFKLQVASANRIKLTTFYVYA